MKTTTRREITARFMKNARRKRVNPWIVIVGGAAATLLVSTVMIFALDRPHGPEIKRRQVKELMTEAARLGSGNEHERATAKAWAALALCQDLPLEAAAIRSFLQEVADDRKAREEAKTEWAALQAELAAKKYEIKELLDKARRLRDHHRTLGMPWASEADALVRRIEDEYAAFLGDRFVRKRERTAETFKLRTRGQEDFAGALAEWRRWIETTSDSEGLARVPAEIARIQLDASEASGDLLRKTERMESKSDAIQILEKALPRFLGCTFDNGERVRDIEKEIRERIEELRGSS